MNDNNNRRLCDPERRVIEVGFLCEICLAPLEDSPPLADDWRVPVSRIKRLCGACSAVEDCSNRDAEGHGSLGGCWLCNPALAEAEVKAIREEADKITKTCTELMADLETSFAKLQLELRGNHIPANHRGDDPDTIGQTPCDCAKDIEDQMRRGKR